MHHNFEFDDVNSALPALLNDLSAAPEVGSRAGRTKELTHVGITLNKPWRREILLDHRKPNIAAQIAETMWVLSGRNDLEFLDHYLPRAKDFSDDGETWRAGYGFRLRKWGGSWLQVRTDQFAYVVDLLKRDRGTRQAVMSIWDPAIDTKPGKDIPCNDWLHFLSRNGYLDLHVAARSNDVIWGWSGINQFEWSALLEIVAGLTGNRVGSLHFSTTSFHLYEHHWAKADRIVEAASAHVGAAAAGESPRFDNGHLNLLQDFDDLADRWFSLEYEIRTGAPVQSSVDQFPEPMLQSWLRVLQWWWSGDHTYLKPLANTALELATHYSVQPPPRQTEILRNLNGQPVRGESAFLKHAIALHNEKHAAYGDSWKRRGEMLGIMANIARKIDRLGGLATADETSADTAMDLMIYLAKYKVWLHDPTQSETTEAANDLLVNVEETIKGLLKNQGATEAWLKQSFDALERRVVQGDPLRCNLVTNMLYDAYRLARYLWEQENEYKGADVD